MGKLDSPKFLARLRIAYLKLNYNSHGYLRIFRIVLDRLGKTNAAQAAAAMAFYAFFSLFPLLLLLIGIGSFLLDNEIAFQKVASIATQILPFAQNMIETNLHEMIGLRGASGSIGIIGYIWSSSSFFTALSRNLNTTAQNAPKRNFFQNRAIALVIVVLLLVFFGLALLSSTLVNVLPQLGKLWEMINIQQSVLWTYLSKIIPVLASFLFFVFLYRFVPGRKSRMKSVLITSAFTSLGWEISSRFFTWMVGAGFIRYEVIYGSIGTLLALMFWIYLICYITITGAHLCTVLEERFNRQEVFNAAHKSA